MNEAYVILAVAIAILGFVVGEAAQMFAAKIPMVNITISTKLGPLELANMPDPYAVASDAVKALILLALGLTGAKLLEIGVESLRRARQEKAWLEYYQQQYYQQQQY
ncbi:MAG: hypothetical protein TU35_004465 [Thermoproteus sp. AZ2]|jgi:flagellar biosynthesis protein FliR|uniref:Uncharacterized protein n=1 Tax=Thermoproteus sp. AZ2 TaxID=1609232 RepID=A0ACC6V0B1_9CREN|nr:MAG: membrane protein [Thermoproteus sp. AZ2]